MHPARGTDAGGEKREALPFATAGVHAARAFGSSHRDLDVDLSAPDRPALVTRLLASCLAPVETMPEVEAAVWQWTAAERLQGLLAIVLATQPAPLSLSTRCQAGACRTPMQIEIDVAAFVAEPGRDRVVCEVGPDRRVTLRAPRGVDQRHWREVGADAVSMATSLVESVDGRAPQPGWRVPPDWLDPLADALAQHDPLTALQLNATCPSCSHVNLVDFDLEDWLLRLLMDAQGGLLDDVHGLAAAYHWSEAEICALPPRRRRAYLARLDREARR